MKIFLIKLTFPSAHDLKHPNDVERKLKQQVNEQFLSCDKFISSYDIIYMSRERLRYPITAKHQDTAKGALSVIRAVWSQIGSHFIRTPFIHVFL